jgi:hypothetical protein
MGKIYSCLFAEDKIDTFRESDNVSFWGFLQMNLLVKRSSLKNGKLLNQLLLRLLISGSCLYAEL